MIDMTFIKMGYIQIDVYDTIFFPIFIISSFFLFFYNISRSCVIRVGERSLHLKPRYEITRVIIFDLQYFYWQIHH